MNNSAFEESFNVSPDSKLYAAKSGEYEKYKKEQADKLKKLRSSRNPELLKLFEERYSENSVDQPNVLDNYLKHLNDGTLPKKKGFFQRLFGNINRYDGGRGRKSRKGIRGRKSRKGRRGRKSRKR